MREIDYRDMLVHQYGERPVWVGATGTHRMELLRAESGSWTLLMIRTNGDACNITGSDRSDIPKQLPRA